MGRINDADLPSDQIDYCFVCFVGHNVTKKYWEWNNVVYSEEQFEKVLKLKAFW